MNPVALFDIVISIRTGRFRFDPAAIIWTLTERLFRLQRRRESEQKNFRLELLFWGEEK